MPEEQGKLFVGGLSWKTTQDSLQQYFSRYGEVTDCVVMVSPETGKSRGFGFITYKDPSCVALVLATPQHILDDKQIDPKACNPRGTTPKSTPRKVPVDKYKKIFVGGLPTNLNEGDLSGFFNKYGEVMDVTIMYDQQKKRSRGFGFVSFASEETIDLLVAEHYVTIAGKQVECKRAEPQGGKGGGQGGRTPQNFAQIGTWGPHSMNGAGSQMGNDMGWGQQANWQNQTAPQGFGGGFGQQPGQQQQWGQQWPMPQQQGMQTGFPGQQPGYFPNQQSTMGSGMVGYPQSFGQQPQQQGQAQPAPFQPQPAATVPGQWPQPTAQPTAPGTTPASVGPVPGQMQVPASFAGYGMGSYPQEQSSYGPARGYGQQLSSDTSAGQYPTQTPAAPGMYQQPTQYPGTAVGPQGDATQPPSYQGQSQAAGGYQRSGPSQSSSQQYHPYRR